MKTIAICTSTTFYKQAIEIGKQLEDQGLVVLMPKSALEMKAAGDFTVRKTWYENADDYHKKTDYIRSHFNVVKKADAILVLNYDKHGIKNYIGGNVLMEMAVAFDQHKQIFVLNSVPEESSFVEEIVGMGSIFLDGDITGLAQKLN